jgi:hypothetical protein
MTYGRGPLASHISNVHCAVSSHSAELVGDFFFLSGKKAPSSAPSCRRRVFDTTGHLLPQGEKGNGAVRPIKTKRPDRGGGALTNGFGAVAARG